jgi:tetratricopeptide (TPR) repeat protein
MEVVQVQLKSIDEQFVELRYRVAGSVEYQSRNLPSAEIAGLYDFIDRGFESDNYYLPKLGRKLFDWLDGSQRWLSGSILQGRGYANEQHRRGLIIAIDAQGRLGGLPWEILFDDKGFLVTRSIVPIRVVGGFAVGERVYTVPDRELRALFMATDPIGVYPKLGFEREERAILQATRDLPMELRVEESGCLDELKGFWRRFRDRFDVFHLNGHADIRDGVPYFITEDLEGRRVDSRLEDFDEVFKLRYPPLMFLSGCRTGQSSDRGASSSLAADLVGMGAPAVLGWGRPVGDDGAIEAAMLLYECLAQGGTLAEALALTYSGLIRQNVPDWCLLRLYAKFGAWDALVLPPEDGMWAPFEEASTDFLDAQGLVKVAGKDGFVGRRRYLQRGLRALKSSSNLGIWLYGIGGVGKSTLAARLLDRLKDNYERLVIVGVLDEDRLKNLLSRQCMNPTGHQILQGDLPLAQKLATFLKNGLNQPKQRFIFVLDDFEQNLELNGNGEQVLKAAVVQPLMALLDGMSLSNLPHRVMITCRYTVQLEQKYKRRIQQFQVERMDKADEEKLFDRLESFSPRSGVDADVRSQAREIADGYPRLLEWLDRVLADPSIDPGAILTAMKDKQAEFLENILAAKLLEQQQQGLRKMLERGTLFDLPVPLGVLKSICGEFDRAELDRHVDRSQALGLLESGLTDGLVRVPKVLNLTLKQKDKQKLAELAVRALYDVWLEKAPTSTEEQQVEIHRLAMLGGDGEIAVEMAWILSNSWIDVSRYREARTFCEETLALQEDSTVIHNLSRIYESLGELNQALTLSQQSIELYRVIGNRQGEASSLHQMSIIYESLGDLNQALILSQQSIEILRAIGNRQGEAASLHQMSMIYQSLGELNQALTLSEQSIEIKRAIGNRQGEAASLAQMAFIAGKQGDSVRKRELNLQAATIFGSICDYGGLVTTLRNLGMDDEPEALGYLAQSLWLTLRLSTNLDSAISLIRAIFNKIPSGDPLKALLGATAVHFCATRSHPELPQLTEQSRNLLEYAASQQGIDTPEEREKWFVADRLGDADYVLAATSELLESIVGDGWLFDRSGLEPTP